MEKPHLNELASAHGGHAVYVNRFVTTSNSAGLKIAFLESVVGSSDQKFRSAVLLSYVDAIELRNLLTEVLAPIEQQLATANRNTF